jgi:hypothetical protein
MLLVGGVASAVVDGGNSVEPPAVCANGTDDPGCADGTEVPVNEPAASKCANGRDDDRDDLVDLNDPGCTSTTDTDETNVVTAACADGDDNDRDELVDLNDPGCTSTTDTDETNPSVDLR